MKKFILMMGLAFFVSAYAVAGDSDNIVNALKQGNAAQFSSYFDNFVDLKLPEKDEIKNVGKTQATITVKNFFNENDIKGFDVTSQREMNGTMYITGKLQGSSKNYNITMLMKVKGDKLLIITIRIN
ncbi:MAG TPA: DUF4783 domain-containing protein [Chitinophagaceae bacterium]|nr:DUF4783 domain-containing protein [Chitinophagaceae bacterium]